MTLKKTTIKGMAEAAGLSVALFSLALNSGDGKCLVGEEMAEKAELTTQIFDCQFSAVNRCLKKDKKFPDDVTVIAFDRSEIWIGILFCCLGLVGNGEEEVFYNLVSGSCLLSLKKY